MEDVPADEGAAEMVLTLAVSITPFLMLPFGITPALVVLGVGLVFTAWLC